MREETERQFRQVLEQHDRESFKSTGPAAECVFREQEFDRRFQERAKDVIEPILAKAKALMHDHGLHSGIVVTQRRTEADGKITPSSIAFEFHVLTDAQTHGFPTTTPSLAFIADAGGDAVVVHENSMLPFFGGHLGIIDRVRLDELTGELVERHLLAFARKVLPGTGTS